MSNYALKLHRGVYVVQTSENGKRIRRSLGTSDKQEALRRLEHIKLTNAVIDRTKQKTIEELFEAYALSLHRRGKSEERWRRIWRYLAPFFATTYPQYVTDEKCVEYCNYRGVSNGTLALELGLLRSILTYAYRQKLIPDAIFIHLPTKPAPKADYVSKERFTQLLAATSQPHIRLFLILAITTGARSNALLDLSWNRVDLQGRRIDLRNGTATNKGRAIVPINDTAFKYLTEAFALRRTEYVIEYNGQRLHGIAHNLLRLSKRTGIKVSAHMLRHSAAVWMAEGGVPMSEIAQYLGHSNTAITERVYARYSPEYLRNAASHLEIEE